MEHREYGRSVAQHVADAIEKSDLSLRQIADKSGMAASTLHRKKSGLGKPLDVEEVFLIAQALGVPSASLYPDEVAS